MLRCQGFIDMRSHEATLKKRHGERGVIGRAEMASKGFRRIDPEQPAVNPSLSVG